MVSIEKVRVSKQEGNLIIAFSAGLGEIVRNEENILALEEMGVRWDEEELDFEVEFELGGLDEDKIIDILTNSTEQVFAMTSEHDSIRNLFEHFIKYVSIKSVEIDPKMKRK